MKKILFSTAACLVLLGAILARSHLAGFREGPCDIYRKGGTPCVTAHSTTRLLYSKYRGPLYQVVRESNGASLDIYARKDGLADSGPFIDFMLEEILNALVGHQGKSNADIADEKGLNVQQQRVLGYLRADRHTTAAKIAADLDMSARQIERMLADMKARGIIRRIGANRNGYWEIVDD